MNPDSLLPINISNVFASAGVIQLVPGQGPATTIKVWRVALTVSLPAGVDHTVLTLYSGSTPLAGTFLLKDGGAVLLEIGRRRWYMTADNEALSIGLSTAGELRGAMAYEVYPW